MNKRKYFVFCTFWISNPLKAINPIFCWTNGPFVLAGLFVFVLISGCSPRPVSEISRVDSSAVHSSEPKKEEPYYSDNMLSYTDHVYDEQIRTVLLEPANFPLQPALLTLGGTDQLRLSFDDLRADYRNLSYTFIHCNADWQPSDLRENEYIEGFSRNFINDYKYSFNTLQPYISYEVRFPDEQTRITQSGNYIILVFDQDIENPVLTMRFMVVENLVGIQGLVNRPSINTYRFYWHEIDFSVRTGGLPVQNPFGEIKPVILQNYRWDNAVTGLKPLFVKEDELVYDYDEANNFPAGNEFRTFDIRSLRYQTEFVRQIERTDSIYRVWLQPDIPWQGRRYVNRDDINGNYVVKNYDGGDDRTESDYALVDFRLERTTALPGGQVYVFGELTRWNFLPEAKMFYDEAEQAYKTRMLLKQGYYDYQYIFLADGEQAADPVPIEGMHFDTELPYLILIYYRPVTGRADRLVGAQFLNSRN